MRIRWLGHACFEIVSKSGTVIVTDPFDATVGYRIPDLRADIVTTSHNHYDHNYVAAVKGDFRHFNSQGSYSVSDIRIIGYPTYHDNTRGAKRGSNIVFVFNVDGLSVCHCGDLGHVPEGEVAKALEGVDILLIPVGGTYTIDAEEAAKTVRLLKPGTVIPMHFKTEAIDFPIEGPGCFLELLGHAGTRPVKELEADAETKGILPEVVVMDYK